MDEQMYESHDAEAARSEAEAELDHQAEQAVSYADYCQAMAEIDAAEGDDPWDVEGAE